MAEEKAEVTPEVAALIQELDGLLKSIPDSNFLKVQELIEQAQKDRELSKKDNSGKKQEDLYNLHITPVLDKLVEHEKQAGITYTPPVLQGDNFESRLKECIFLVKKCMARADIIKTELEKDPEVLRHLKVIEGVKASQEIVN